MLRRIADHWYNPTVRSMINQDLAKASDQFGTLLHYAARDGNAELIRYLIELGSEVDAVGEDGQTPLMLAAYHGQNLLETIILLEAGANVDIADVNGETALHMALNRLNPRTEITQAILCAVKLKTTTIEELVEKLLSVGCTFTHATLLRDTEVLTRLLQRGLDVNSRYREDETALHVAAELNDLDMAKFLIDCRADVNAPNQFNDGPLYYAARNKNVDMLRILLENKANPNCVNSFYGFTPLYVLYANGTIVDADEFAECAAVLLRHGAVPKNPRFVAKTLLDCALDHQNSRGTDYLIAHLAMLEVVGAPTISVKKRFSKADRSKIVKFEENYKLCQQVLKIVIFDKLSLLNLLTEQEYNMRLRVRNETNVTRIKDSCSKHELDKLCPYYYDSLMRCISKARRSVELEDEVILVICKIFKRSFNECYPAAREICSYLSERDLVQLCQV